MQKQSNFDEYVESILLYDEICRNCVGVIAGDRIIVLKKELQNCIQSFHKYIPLLSS